MAHKKGVGSSRNGRDSNPKFRGIKKYGGEAVRAGNIIVRQCGTKMHPGRNVGLGTDYTIYALVDGVVRFHHKDKCQRRSASGVGRAGGCRVRGLTRDNRSIFNAPGIRPGGVFHRRDANRVNSLAPATSIATRT